MKETIEKHRHGELMLVKDRLNSKEKKILGDYVIYLNGGACEQKVRIVERQLLMIRDISGVSYDKWDLTKLRKFLAVLNKSELANATKNDIKKHFKRFLKEQYEDWSLRFRNLKDIRCGKDVNVEKINANTILQPGELEKLIRGVETLKFKALIILLYESGARPKEVLTARWKDLDLENGDIQLISTKNKTARNNPIKESIIHLRRFKQEYPYPDVQPNDFIFPSQTDRKEHFSVNYFSVVFRKLSIKVLGRALFPYILRHTRATELQKVLTPKIYEKFMDHSIEMASRYSHLNKDDVREQLLEKVYHIEEPTEKEKEGIKTLKKEMRLIRKRMEMFEDMVKTIAPKGKMAILNKKGDYTIIEHENKPSKFTKISKKEFGKLIKK